MFGLSKEQINFILEILKKNIPDKKAKFYIFGSRAKGNYKKYSDIDIAIDLNGEKIPSAILAEILINFEDSTLPFEVDVVDINSIDEKFKSIIKDELIEF